MDIELLAIDVDGTLIGADQRIPEDVVEAIHAASQQGLRVCLATGRSFIETIDVWRQLRLPEDRSPEPMVLIGGALVSEPTTGRTLYQKSIPPETARRCGEALQEIGYSALGIVDAWRWEVDYLVVRGDDSDRAEAMWFGQMPGIRKQIVERFGEAEPDVLRINAVVSPEEGPRVEAHLRGRLGDSVRLHTILAPNYGVTIVEMFSAEASKWAGVYYVAQSHRIGPGAIAAVGDDVNDIPMLQGAGRGVAVTNASPMVKEAADVVAEEGLAGFVRSLLGSSQ